MFERPDGVERWPRDRPLATWEAPLKPLSAAVVVLAGGLLAMRL